MTPYDAAMAGVIVAGMVWGAFRGITWQLASIASLVLGYSVSHPLSVQLAPHFPGEPVVARALAMLAVYFAVSAGVFLTAWVVRATLRRMKFEAFDRHLGMILGGLEGALLGLVVTLFVVSLAPQTRGPIFASPTGQAVGQLMSVLGPVLPEEARGVLSPF
ncbi:MAG: CvpA family protein, partial [Planctomycetia bacterium]|nr:CvpA family protein [Planctomycetia bacterium]